MAYLSINFTAKNEEELLKLRKVLFSNPEWISESEEECHPEISGDFLAFNSEDNCWINDDLIRNGRYDNAETFTDAVKELFKKAGIEAEYTCWYEGRHPEDNFFAKDGKWVRQYDLYDEKYWAISDDGEVYSLGEKNTVKKISIEAKYKGKVVDKFTVYLDTGDEDESVFSSLDSGEFTVGAENMDLDEPVDLGSFSEFSNDEIKEKMLENEDVKYTLLDAADLPEDAEINPDDWTFEIVSE